MRLEWKTCFKVGISIFLLYLCIHYFSSVKMFLTHALSAASPLVAGGIVAYLVNILMNFYEKRFFPRSERSFVKKIRRPVCMVGSFVTLILIVVLIISLVLPQLVSCIRLVLDYIPDAMDGLVKRLEKLDFVPEDIINQLSGINWQDRLLEFAKMAGSYFGNVVDAVVKMITSVFSWIVTALLSIIFAFYLLLSKEKLSSQIKAVIKRYTKENVSERIKYTVAVVNECFHNYIVGQCIEAVILGFMCTIGMLVFRLPYATMIGALVAFTALIPIAGAYIGAFVGAFMILMVSPVKALVFLILIVVLQQIEGNVIYPKVVGSSIGLPAIWVLAAITIGGGIFGIPGMIIGVPLTAAVYRFVREDVYKNSNKKTI